MRRVRKQQQEPAPKRNTRALARRLFPQWPRHQQAAWALAKLRVMSCRWSHPVGNKFAPPIESADHAPDFLRGLPSGPPLEIKHDRRDKVRGAMRYVKGFAK